ncbi:MAG: T9SS type A sorting domain-containing protein [Bacteroidales bacterium]|nr:T9SS type A sorting domain-containing protein [Bacteroidales bacterium]
MKNRISLAVALSLLLGLLSVELQAQRIITDGDNLNIGSGNNLFGGGLGRPTGNAIGLDNTLSSQHTLTVGLNDTIDENSEGAVALGALNYIQGEAAMAFGRSVKVTGNDNIGMGHHIRVNGLSCGMVIGSGIEGTLGADAYLVNDSSNCLMVGFNSTKPTLFVGASPNDYGQGILNKTGRVAIGDVMPQAKLHIRSDIGEDASLILEPGDSTADSTYIRIHDVRHGVSVNSRGQMFITAGINNPLNVTSKNYNVDGDLMSLGTDGFVLSTDGTPFLSLNAYPSGGQYRRGSGQGPSYAMEFGNAAWKLRTAKYVDPRGTVITNWRDAVTVTTNGDITLNGKVGVNIENTTSDYALAVDGGLITTKVHIQEVGDWQDCVFGEDYHLMPLAEVESFVAENRHLPGIPSEAEVKAEGYDVAVMQAALLGKVEELTLHLIRQQKEIDSLRTLVTVHFGYDACGNRTSRTLEFSDGDGDKGVKPGDNPDDGATLWQASVSDSFAGGEAMLFPNPTERGFILSLTGMDMGQGAQATLSTLDGRVLEERHVTGPREEFDLGGRPAGIYLLRLATEREAKVWKVIKRN